MNRRFTLRWRHTLLLSPARQCALARRRGAPKAAAPRAQAPRFEVDPMWPKPMPNRWILGSTTGVAVDSRDHVFVVH